MIVNVIGHWVFGLPVGYALCFQYGWGVAGLWVGLSIGLVLTAVVLVAVWWKRTRVMQNAEFRMQKSTGQA
jgi:MATE family multidrug resistance protein